MNRCRIGLLIAVAVIAAIFYGHFLGNFFAFDDLRYLENIITGPRAIALGYNAQLRLVSNFAWVPLFWVSGYSPVGYNLFMVTVAALNALLVYGFLKKLLEREDIPLLAAVIFMAAPAGADAIFWRMSLSTLLSLFFCLVTLNLYLTYRKTSDSRFFLASCGTYLLAMFSKDDAAALVAILFAAEILFYRGWEEKGKLARRLVPYLAVVVFFLTVSSVTFRLLQIKSETWGAFQFKPLYSLLGGFTSFIIAPDGFLTMSDPGIYILALLVPATFLLVREKKLLVFGYLWIIFTFMPSSLTSIAQFQPAHFPNSISRFLYTPSVGAALVASVVLAGIAARWRSTVSYGVCGILLAIYLYSGCRMVHARGTQWRETGQPLRIFLEELQQIYVFPQHSYVFVANAPAGRAFVQQALRAFYRNPTITWITDPQSFRPPTGEKSYIIECAWLGSEKVRIVIYDFQTGSMVAQSP
jgi:hypothetical protein